MIFIVESEAYAIGEELYVLGGSKQKEDYWTKVCSSNYRKNLTYSW